ncbi:MAG TPA: hypothetical protein VMS17_08675 [Gemmataceae bacterium]|nr:hypothetical protein [Gemmataceae bacterium]
MAERLYCRKGHRWTPTFAPNVWPPDFRSSCPTCGDAPLGPFDMTQITARVMIVVSVAFLAGGLGLLFVGDVGLAVGIGLLIAAGVIALIGLIVRINRQNTQKMADLAEQMGFAFMPNLTVGSLRAVAPFQLYTHGHSQRAYHALQGRVGDCDLLIFKYQYTIGGGKHQHTHTHSAVLVFDGADGVPDFLLTPRSFFDKLVGFFTHSGVELEDAGEFAKRCKLTGPDPTALRKTFHPELVQYLARDGRWHIQALNDQLIVYRSPAIGRDRIPGMATDALQIRDMLRGADLSPQSTPPRLEEADEQ